MWGPTKGQNCIPSSLFFLLFLSFSHVCDAKVLNALRKNCSRKIHSMAGRSKVRFNMRMAKFVANFGLQGELQQKNLSK
jgi:hypothetical protein